jgi:hypothetical protein
MKMVRSGFWWEFDILSKPIPDSFSYFEKKRCTVPHFTACVRTKQFSESGPTGSTYFWASRIRIHYSEVWIRIRLRIRVLLSSSKTSKKNIYSYCFVTSFGLFIFEKLCKYTVKKYPISRKTFFFKFVFCWRLEGQ